MDPLSSSIPTTEILNSNPIQSIYNCPRDSDFLHLVELKTLDELEDVYLWLKLKFDILNTKCVLNEFGNIISSSPTKEDRTLDVYYYPSLLSWHYSNCQAISKNRKYSHWLTDEKKQCDCKFGLKYPDIYLEDNTDILIERNRKNWCFSGYIYCLTRMENNKFGNYPSLFLDRKKDDRWFGKYFAKYETAFSNELWNWPISRLITVRNNVASRLRLLTYLKFIKKYGISSKYFGIKIVDGWFHVNVCENDSNSSEVTHPSCDCCYAFDNPKGWFHNHYKFFEPRDSGMAFIKRPLFSYPN